jgi:hypothetical protein
MSEFLIVVSVGGERAADSPQGAGGGARTDGPPSVSEPALQADSGGVRVALVKRNLGSAERGRLDITSKWDDIQVCIIRP